MYVQALIAVYLIGKLSCKLFFGTLRPAESEVIYIFYFLLFLCKFYKFILIIINHS